MPDYIIEPLDTDPEAIFQDFVEFVQEFYPNYQVSEGQLDVIIARFFAVQSSFTADMASRVQRAIFRYFGNSLANIPPLPGSFATASVNFVVSAPVGTSPSQTLLIPTGTLMGIIDIDGDMQLFSLIEDINILATEVSVVGNIRALEQGVVSNGLTGPVQMIEQVDWVTSATVSGATSGGTDPEEDDDYINRLTQNLVLMAPRPLLANDFAIMSKNVAGVYRASVIENFGGGANEVQRITSNYTAGNFTITFSSLTTANLPFNATAVQVEAALAALAVVDETDFTVTGGPLPTTPIEVAFVGRYGYTNVAAITVNNVSLSGGSSIGVLTTTTGAAYNTVTENSIALSGVDESGELLSTTTRNELIAYLGSFRAQNFVITYIDAAYNSVDVTFAGYVGLGHDADSVKTTVIENLTDYLSPGNWARSQDQGITREWVYTNTLRYLELTTIVENTTGWDYTTSLTFSVNGGGSTNVDKTLLGVFPLTRPGTMTGTVLVP
jgi:hypothetical protein